MIKIYVGVPLVGTQQLKMLNKFNYMQVDGQPQGIAPTEEWNFQ